MIQKGVRWLKKKYIGVSQMAVQDLAVLVLEMGLEQREMKCQGNGMKSDGFAWAATIMHGRDGCVFENAQVG
jgi:hypothetical protein